ncbi:hypothetical protein QA649_37455 [Bradyrhizobium sp. CB1717]|uniref:hypothetical protein n=1 Tax=Bradyrhizobium sp. CB1717 TaxID=3039154 RepID=UPI0024B14C85|nr:hypothetical protein [Bradyrhizobium sp. CB1717]WFU23640.1 hypothetical protein QA649_37455 [Bradyrhizobium sp. CB1717]
MAELAATSGYSAAVLMRQIRLRTWIEAKAAELDVDPKAYMDAGFAGLEAVMMIDRHEPGRTRRLLDAVVAGNVTVESLRRDLRSLVGEKRLKDSHDRDALSAARHERRRRVKLAIETGGHGAGRGELLTVRPVWRRTDGSEAEHGPICRFTWWRPTTDGPEGFDLMHLPAGTAGRAVDDRIGRAIATSTSFWIYQIVLMEPTPFLPRIVEAIDWARLRHVGIYMATLGPPGSQTVSIAQERAAEPGSITDRVEDFLRAVARR